MLLLFAFLVFILKDFEWGRISCFLQPYTRGSHSLLGGIVAQMKEDGQEQLVILWVLMGVLYVSTRPPFWRDITKDSSVNLKLTVSSGSYFFTVVHVFNRFIHVLLRMFSLSGISAMTKNSLF